MNFIKHFKILIIACLMATFGVSANINTTDFADFLDNVRSKALQNGVSKVTLDNAFIGLEIDPMVLKYDRHQAEFTQNFWYYLSHRVNKYRLKLGIKKLSKNHKLLQKIYEKYGVDAHILTAFWGLESNYGANTGKLSLVRSLATLGYDKRRSKFFTRQLLALLKLIDDGKIPHNAQGSWAGAMGNTQFIPTNVAAYAVDYNQNGKLGLWDENGDIFASSANFLQNIGWHKDEVWGFEVKIAADFDFKQSGLASKKTINDWAKLGVLDANGDKLPASKMPTSLILPMGYQGPAFLVGRNFQAILRWNRSILYALAVGVLADRLSGRPNLVAEPIIEPSLNRDDIFKIQTVLNKLGFDSGKIDGIAGVKTRGAVRKYQQSNNLPIDGYVGWQLLQRLKR